MTRTTRTARTARTRTTIARRTGIALTAAASLIALSACSAPAETTPASTAEASTAPSPSATPEATADSAALTDADLEALFTGIQFVPGEYAGTGELLESIYPGLTVSDVSCLTPFGAGWETTVEEAGGAAAYGTSNDRSMTAVLVSAADVSVAEDLVADAEDAISRCADGQELFAMQGMPVTTTVSPVDLDITGVDEVQGWQVTGEVGGSPFSLIGATVRTGQDALALVGWDPSNNESFVPQATQMFVDRVAEAQQ